MKNSNKSLGAELGLFVIVLAAIAILTSVAYGSPGQSLMEWLFELPPATPILGK